MTTFEEYFRQRREHERKQDRLRKLDTERLRKAARYLKAARASEERRRYAMWTKMQDKKGPSYETD